MEARLKKAEVDQLIKGLVDRGMIVEAGWQGFVLACLTDAPEIQVREMRKAFFAGAQHLFASIMSILDEGSEPTEQDLARMTLIADELKAFVGELKNEMN